MEVEEIENYVIPKYLDFREVHKANMKAMKTERMMWFSLWIVELLLFGFLWAVMFRVI